MTDTFGPISETPLAFYDPDSLCWRTSQGTFPWEPPRSLETLPASGMTQNGRLFERPTLGHLTNENDGFVSLPTPRAQNGEARNMNIWARPLDQPQNLENALARLNGASTAQLFDAGNEC